MLKLKIKTFSASKILKFDTNRILKKSESDKCENRNSWSTPRERRQFMSDRELNDRDLDFATHTRLGHLKTVFRKNISRAGGDKNMMRYGHFYVSS